MYTIDTINPTLLYFLFCSIVLYNNHDKKKVGQLINLFSRLCRGYYTSISTLPQAYYRQPLGLL